MNSGCLVRIRARSDEQGFFAKYFHTFVSVFQINVIEKRLNCLSILRNRYNPMKIVTADCKACNFGKEFGGNVCSCERALRVMRSVTISSVRYNGLSEQQ